MGSSAAGKFQASYPVTWLDLSFSAMETWPLEGNGTVNFTGADILPCVYS